MEKSTDRPRHLYAQLKEELDRLHHQPRDIVLCAADGMLLCQEALRQLRTWQAAHPFTCLQEEIHFFKSVKPLFIAEAVYYNKVYFLHARWLTGNSSMQQQYLREAISRLEVFYEEIHDFITYHRSGCIHLDEYYFSRRSNPALMQPEGSFDGSDPFSSGFDVVLGKLQAWTRFGHYLQTHLQSLQEGLAPAKRDGIKPIPWIGTKAGLVELIKALESARVLGNGNITLKQIVALFECMFMIDLGNCHDIYLDIRSRKTNPTRFIDELKKSLLKDMEAYQ